MAILRVTGLVKTYSRRRVVDGVDFAVMPGEIVGLLGANGAGKTTCFRMTCGMVKPDRGQVELAGIDVTDWPMFRRAKDGGMGYLAQESSIFRKLTARDNLLCVMEMIGMGRRERRKRCTELLDRFQLNHIKKSRAEDLSGGEKRRLEFARCLISDPAIILLDEPFAAVDPVTVNDIQTVIRELRESGISFLITDHSVRETLAITDRSYVMKEGKILCHGSPSEVINHPEARRSYFGESIQIDEPADQFRGYEAPPNVPPPHFSADSHAPESQVSAERQRYGQRRP